jgi:hypothetical protein
MTPAAGLSDPYVSVAIESLQAQRSSLLLKTGDSLSRDSEPHEVTRSIFVTNFVLWAPSTILREVSVRSSPYVNIYLPVVVVSSGDLIPEPPGD